MRPCKTLHEWSNPSPRDGERCDCGESAWVSGAVGPAVTVTTREEVTMRITLWVHGDKDNAYEVGERAGLRGEALEMFKFASVEHKLEYEVNPDTGLARVVKIDDREVSG